MRWIRSFPLLIVLIATLGCAYTLEDLDKTYIAESFVLGRWLSFIRDDSVSRDEVIQLLGRPTEVFEEGGILVYRLILAEKEIKGKRPYLFLWRSANPVLAFNSMIPTHNKIRNKLASQDDALGAVGRRYDWKLYLQILGRQAEYNLVLVFDERATLRRYRLLRVKP